MVWVLRYRDVCGVELGHRNLQYVEERSANQVRQARLVKEYRKYCDHKRGQTGERLVIAIVIRF
jgi:hypothetical protein